MNHADIANFLLEKGAVTQCSGEGGITALHQSAGHGQLELLRRLLQDIGVDVKTKENLTPLHFAAREGHLEVVMQLWLSKAEINASSSAGVTPLYLAARNGHVAVVNYLLKKGANPCQETNERWGPLAAASLNGNCEAIISLIINGAPVEAQTNQNFTALHIAAANGNLGAVERLLNAGADPNTKSSINLWSPLLSALSNGHLEVADKLLEGGASATHRTKTGISALHLVAEIKTTDAQKLAKQVDITEKLIQMGCEIKFMAQGGPSLIIAASISGNIELFNRFLSGGAPLEHRDQYGRTALHIAAYCGHLPIVNRLLEMGVGANVLSIDHESPLIEAADTGHTEVLKCLLEAQSNPNQVTNIFDTPLQVATYYYWESSMEVLLDHGADPWALGAFGRSSVDWAYLHDPTAQIMRKRNLGLKVTDEAMVTSRLRLNARLLIERIISDPQKDEFRFNALGYVLSKLNEVDDSCVAFEQRVRDKNRVTHNINCNSCKSDEIEGKRFICKVCAALNLCEECMDKYNEGVTVRGCIGHEFLEVPRPRWNDFAPEAVNKNGETIHQWTERIYFKYRDAVISPEEARSIGYKGPPANLPFEPSTTSQVSQLETVVEINPQSESPITPNANIDSNEIRAESNVENLASNSAATMEANNTQVLLSISEVGNEDAGSTSEDVNRGGSSKADLIQAAPLTTNTTVATLSGPKDENSGL